MSDRIKNIANLSPEQQALLFQRLQEKRTSPQAAQIHRLSSDEQYFPLSFSQQRLWFLDRWQPESALYNIPIAVRLSGRLHIEALQQSMQELVQRHEGLRTTFVQREGQPVQQIVPCMEIPFVSKDLGLLPEQERGAVALAQAVEEVCRPFDLVHGPLLRMLLLRLDSEDHLLVLTLHHIIADGWSLGVLLKELTLLYAAYSTQNTLCLPELPIRYGDFAVWQRAQLQGALLDTHLSYWKKQLADIPAIVELPTDHPRPAIQTFRGARHTFLLPKQLTEALQKLSQSEAVTLFMLLLAAFQTLLYRYTGQEDIVVGTPIAHRTQAELEGLIGFFVNTLALRTDLSGAPRFTELLDRVREVTLEAYAHQDLPFERLVELLQPERDNSHTPILQVMFALQNTPTSIWNLEGLTISEVPLDTGTAKFDLVLLMEEVEGGLRGNLTYSTDLFEKASIQRIVGHYQTLLEGIVQNPTERIAALPFLTAYERNQLLVAWNTTITSFPQGNLCLHQLFEAQVEQAPEAVAVIFEGQELTYDELNRRANLLAHYLCQLGVGPEVVVGVCLERGIEMVVGLLGILKAGGAYLPLDPLYPQERLDFMLRDAQVALLLTQQRLGERLAISATPVLYLDALPTEPQFENALLNPISEVTPENLAYIIYTSGSTGTPKGISIRHRGVVNNISDLNARFNVGMGDRLLALSSLSFDMCVYELFGMLAAGATTIIPDPGKSQDPAHWAALLARYQVTLWNSAPSLLEALVEYVERQPELHLRSLRLALLGGDWSPVALPGRLRAVAEKALFVNLGGATELSIHSTIYPVELPDPRWRSLPYGKPMANQQAYILDTHFQLVPVGVSGELYLGGTGLARGYLRRPDLTAERFIPHPFDREPGARLYRTGDLARFRSDGTIELLGRSDFQVKIRGLRIELGEIAAVLREHPMIQDAIVSVREDQPGNKQLIAYVLFQEGSTPLANELWSFLHGKLPGYMLPAAFVPLDTFPLSPNGKVDRRVLPSPEQGQLEAANLFVAPRTPVEEVLCGIWADVLNLEQVGVYDNFFQLGGHSLLATRIIAHIQDILLVETPLRLFFTTPTIAALAEYLEKHSRQEQRDINEVARIYMQIYQLSEDQVQSILTTE